MPCTFDATFSEPRAVYSDQVGDDIPVVDIQLDFHESVVLWVYDRPIRWESGHHSERASLILSYFSAPNASLNCIRVIMSTVHLPLVGKKAQMDTLVSDIADFVRRSLDGIKAERLARVELKGEIRIRADLALEKAKVWFASTNVIYGRGDDDCAVCMTEFEQGMEVQRTPCGHCFHLNCLWRWLMRSGTCPLCRARVSGSLTADGFVLRNW